MKIAYMAHPFGVDLDNLRRAKEWLRFLVRAVPDIEFCAPWIPLCEVLDDALPAERERMLEFDCNLAARCDLIVTCGDHISRGMQREVAACLAAGKSHVDFTNFGDAALDAPQAAYYAFNHLRVYW